MDYMGYSARKGYLFEAKAILKTRDFTGIGIEKIE